MNSGIGGRFAELRVVVLGLLCLVSVLVGFLISLVELEPQLLFTTTIGIPVVVSLFINPILTLSVYGSDLHKVLVDVTAVLLGQPGAFRPYLELSDQVMGLVAVVALIIAILRGKARWWRWLNSTSVISQILLASWLLFGLVIASDGFSRLRFVQFLGGNLFLLLAPMAICHNITHVRRFWRVWMLMSFVLGLISLWLTAQGLVWTDARNQFVKLSNNRAGSVGAIAIIYLIATYGGTQKPRERILRVLAVAILGLATVSTVSKGSIFALIICLGLYGGISMLLRKNSGLTAFRSWLQTLVASGLIFFAIMTLDASGLYPSSQVIGQEAMQSSLASRQRIFRHYLPIALSSPLVGSGIISIYTLGPNGYPHNIFMELFVASGIIGVMLFLIFLRSTLAAGWGLVRMTVDRPEIHGVAMATLLSVVFLLLMAQIDNDLVGNRHIWLFSGLLLAMAFRYGRIKDANGTGGFKIGEAERGCKSGHTLLTGRESTNDGTKTKPGDEESLSS